MIAYQKKAKYQNPKKLFIFAHTKVGKTTLAAALPNSLIIDTEDGSNFVEGYVFNLKQEMRRTGKTAIMLLKELSEYLRKSEHKFDYIVIDTVTALQDVAENFATYMYKQTTLGKNFKGESVLDLPQGAGYRYLRQAFSIIYKWFEDLPQKSLVLLGHVKASSILKDGKELTARDIELIGKLKQILSADCDAIGYLYRNKEKPNETILSFKTELQDLATGARPAHLRNKEFIVSVYNPETESFSFYWDKIFINEQKEGVNNNVISTSISK